MDFQNEQLTQLKVSPKFNKQPYDEGFNQTNLKRFGPKMADKAILSVARIWNIWDIFRQHSQHTFVTVPPLTHH